MNELIEMVDHGSAWQSMSPQVQLALTLGSLALLPALLVTMTCFTRIIIVLAFVRQGMATQSVPPNTVLTGLALFLTLFIMRPTIDEIGTKAVKPYMDKKIDEKNNAEVVVADLPHEVAVGRVGHAVEHVRELLGALEVVGRGVEPGRDEGAHHGDHRDEDRHDDPADGRGTGFECERHRHLHSRSG